MSVADKVGNDFGFHNGLRAMAEIASEQGRYEEAEELYRGSLDRLTNAVSRDFIGAEVQVALGRVLLSRGMVAQAEVELRDALARVSGNTVSIVLEASANEALAEVLERKGEHAAALAALRKAVAFREKIAQQEARSKSAQVEARAAVAAAQKDAEIHQLRYVELHGVQSKLVEAEKMALLGRLAAGTAHELNTPLGVLRSNNETVRVTTERLLAAIDGEQATKLRSVLESCRRTSDEAVSRISSIATSLGRFTHLDRSERRTFDVREGLDSALELLASMTGDDIEIERRFGEVPGVDGWPREVNLAFLTVLQNAVQAMDGPGTVVASTSATDEHVLVRIEDTGRGMTEAQVANLFDVAWSEEGSRTSMRLGLSAAYATMQKHGGTIEVESVVGEGTAVTFSFAVKAE